MPESGGWRVSAVDSGSAAEKAGIKPNDIVMTVNGKAINEIAEGEIGKLFGSPKPVALQVLRNGDTLDVSVTPQRVEAGS